MTSQYKNLDLFCIVDGLWESAGSGREVSNWESRYFDDCEEREEEGDKQEGGQPSMVVHFCYCT